ncbi:Lung seven transmembrane receptor-like protein [Raphanus sativus]|nr:Lung seven transmembrane receptor-like protein [Raphanus sativus]
MRNKDMFYGFSTHQKDCLQNSSVVSIGFKANLCGKALFLGLGVIYLVASSAFECSLQIGRNMAKLQLYRNITNAFATYVFLSTGWISFELYFFATKSIRRTWIIPVGWNLLYYGLLAIQCVIWGAQIVEDSVTGN